ncbi:MAG: STAS domain-containing protein [Burkholderiaceae bacterium]
MYSIPGAITMTNASQSLADLCKAVDAGETDIDLGSLAHSDSSALAVVLATIRHGQASGKALHVSAMPPALQSLAKLYGVQDLIDAAAPPG